MNGRHEGERWDDYLSADAESPCSYLKPSRSIADCHAVLNTKVIGDSLLELFDIRTAIR
jgi:hypothetical protein